jgi:hypothetical protein
MEHGDSVIQQRVVIMPLGAYRTVYLPWERPITVIMSWEQK